MARVVAFVPDLLFGSAVMASVRAAGHEAVLVSTVEALVELAETGPGADALIVDLTYEAGERVERVSSLRPPGVKVLAFYSHVEADVRARALEAGFDVVVPRSRMAREGDELVRRLLAFS